jgi:hypothetical protein
LEKGTASKIKPISDQTYTAEYGEGDDKIRAKSQPFNALASGALVVTSGVTRNGLFVGNNKFAPQENEELADYGRVEAEKVIKEDKRASRILDKTIAAVQTRMDVNLLIEQRKQQEEAEQANKDTKNKKGSSSTAAGSDLDDITAGIGKLSLNKPLSTQERLDWSNKKWNTNLHAEHGTLVNLAKVTQGLDGTPGNVGETAMIARVSSKEAVSSTLVVAKLSLITDLLLYYSS